MKQVLATLVGWWVRAVTREWALRRGLADGLATLMAWVAGAATSAAILRV